MSLQKTLKVGLSKAERDSLELRVKNETISLLKGVKGIESPSVLNRDYPNGDNGIYVIVGENQPKKGQYYGWDGSAWQEIGTYQSTQIGVGEVEYANFSNTLKEELATKEWVEEGFSTEHEVHSIRKEILDLKEEIYGTILDVTTIEVNDNDIVPSVVEVGGSAYNVLPKGDIEVLEVSGDSVASENLLGVADKTINTNNSNITIANGLITCKRIPNSQLDIELGSVKITKGVHTLKTFASTIQGSVIILVYLNDTQVQVLQSNDTDVLSMNLESGTYRFVLRISTSATTFDMKPMLVRGDVAPTEFKPYFSGIKSVEYERVDVLSPNVVGGTTNIGTRNGIVKTYDYATHTFSFKGTLNEEVLDNPWLGTLPIKPFQDPFIAGEEYTAKVFDYQGFKTTINFGHSGTWGISLDLRKTDSVTFRAGTNRYGNIGLGVYPSNGMVIGEYYDISFKFMIVKGSNAPTEFAPYNYQSSILQTPTTLNGLEGYRDTLEVRLNHTTELYDVYKIKRTEKITLNGSENWRKGSFDSSVADTTLGKYFINLNNGKMGLLPSAIHHKSSWIDTTANYIWTGAIGISYHSKDVNDAQILPTLNVSCYYNTIETFKAWLQANPIDVVYPLETPTEDLIQSNLDFEQVTAMGYVNSPIDIVDANNEYGTKPETKLAVVYKNTAIAR